MNSRSIIGVHIEDGVIQKITSNTPNDAAVVVFDDDRPTRTLAIGQAADSELQDGAEIAVESTRCHGIGIACDVASERLAELSKTKFNSSAEYVEEIAKLLDGLREMVVRSIRLDVGIEAA